MNVPIFYLVSSCFFAFTFTCISALLVVKYSSLHEHLTGDHDTIGIQKSHDKPVPRIGGICVYFGILVGLGCMQMYKGTYGLGLLILWCSIPAVAFGVAEDITKKIGVCCRILGTTLSPYILGVVVGSWLTKVNLPSVDHLLLYQSASIFVTCIAVSGLTNSFNIIDGYNGLSSMVAVIILLGIVIVSRKVEDMELFVISLVIICSVLGFFVWNYPLGLLFLGDGGAYLLGFFIAELSILLVERNLQVSPWFPFLLALYPIFETLFTIIRRLILNKRKLLSPDASHLHQLVNLHVIKMLNHYEDNNLYKFNNSLTSPFMWMLTSLTVIPAIIFWNNTIILQILSFLFAIVYIYIYHKFRRISRECP